MNMHLNDEQAASQNEAVLDIDITSPVFALPS
jgi:hypothetical protein